jgi:hypothetical protein
MSEKKYFVIYEAEQVVWHKAELMIRDRAFSVIAS